MKWDDYFLGFLSPFVLMALILWIRSVYAAGAELARRYERASHMLEAGKMLASLQPDTDPMPMLAEICQKIARWAMISSPERFVARSVGITTLYLVALRLSDARNHLLVLTTEGVLAEIKNLKIASQYDPTNSCWGIPEAVVILQEVFSAEFASAQEEVDTQNAKEEARRLELLEIPPFP